MKYGLRLRLVIAPMAAVIAGSLYLAAPPAYAVSGSAMLNGGSGYCMGVASSGNAGQYACTDSDNQIWRRADVVPGSHTTFWIENGGSQCLYAPSETKGAGLKGGTCLSKNNYRWYRGSCSGSYCEYVSAENTSFIIGISGGSESTGARAVLWTATGAANQYWLWTSG